MNLQDKDLQFKKIIEHAHQEFGSIRTNRATPSLLENIKIDAYGTQTPLIQLASITLPEPTQLLVEVWDKNLLKEVEKNIHQANLGLSVSNEGDHLRVVVPAMTDETRQQIIKSLHKKLEEIKISIRNLRDKIKEEILKAEKEKEISEDEKYKLIEELDKKTKDYTQQVEDLAIKKEKEINL